MTKAELAQFNQDTRDSVRGKNNYQPVSNANATPWPRHNPLDMTTRDPWADRNDHPKN